MKTKANCYFTEMKAIYVAWSCDILNDVLLVAQGPDTLDSKNEIQNGTTYTVVTVELMTVWAGTYTT